MSSEHPIADGLPILAGLIRSPATAGDVLGALTDTELLELVSIARAHGVEAWLAGSASLSGLPHRAAAELGEQRARFIAARARARDAVGRFSAVAAEIDCPWVLLKGQALAEQFYPRPHMRHAVDTDVLVPPNRFAHAVGALERRGWALIDRNWSLSARSKPGQLRMMSDDGRLLDLHWHLLDDPGLRRRFRMSTTEMLGRRRILASGWPVLDAADQLVHLGVHAALSGANRLIWLLDVGFAARDTDDWGLAAARARTAGAGAALGLVLLRAHRWLGTPAPRDALGAMGAGRGWRNLCTLADRCSPLRVDPTRPALSRALARSTCASPARTAAEFGRHVQGFLHRAPGGGMPADVARDPRDPRSPLFDASNPAARQAYLDYVSSG